METSKRKHDAAAGDQKKEESEGPEKKRFFLASKKNNFGGFLVEAVMIDTGCNSILLPLNKDELPTLAKVFPFDSFWDVGNSRVASRSLTLKITPSVPGDRIPIRLCTDLLPEKPYEVDFIFALTTPLFFVTTLRSSTTYWKTAN